MRDTLFRSQILEEKAKGNLGEAFIVLPSPVNVLIGILLAAFVTASLFLFFGTYSRRESAVGILLPNRGMIKVFAPNSAIIDSVAVKDGQSVKAGDVIFTLSQSKALFVSQDDVAERVTEMKALILNLEQRFASLSDRKDREAASIKLDLKNTEETLETFAFRSNIDTERLKIKASRSKRIEPLTHDNSVSADEYQQHVDGVLQLKNQKESARQVALQTESQYIALKAKLESLDSTYADEEGGLLDRLAQARSELSGLALQQLQSIASPIDGKVSSIQGYPGLTVDSQKPLAVILPDSSELEGHLYIPSRAIAHVNVGQRVLLQYDAFPIQKYGVQGGIVTGVSQTILAPREIAELDMSSAIEPLYRITVKLDRQDISAFGRKIVLQSGMVLKADIVLSKRSLIEWILEPLYRAKESQ